MIIGNREDTMPAKGDKARRHKKIEELIGTYEVEHQGQLVKYLKDAGIPATQSGVSRDLREMGAFRVDGVYELPDQTYDDTEFQRVKIFMREARPAGPFQSLILTEYNCGTLVARAIDATGFREVVGTVAGTDSVLVLTENEAGQRRFFNRLNQFMTPESQWKENQKAKARKERAAKNPGTPQSS